MGIKLYMLLKIKRNLFLKVDATGLAIFRIFYSVILFCEILQIFECRRLIYDKIPFEVIGEIKVDFLFGFWFVFVVLLILGLYTRVSTIVNYLFSVIIFSSAQAFEYHVFYAYVGINFLLMFMPVSRVLSLDSLIQKIKYSDTGNFYKPGNKVLAANYLVPVFVGIALVYFDSILFKFTSPMWLKGLGMWLPANLPMATWSDITAPLMNIEWLVKFLGYLVIAFETVFIFLFWFKPFRIPLLLLGVFFHLGILIEFPIPWFALTAVAVYLLMVPVSWWRKAGNVFKAKKPSYKFYYDAECPLCVKTVVLIRHFDVFNKVVCLPVQGNYLQEKAFENKTEEELLINIRGVSKNGKVLVGYDAYTGLLRAMIYSYPVGLLLNFPVISALGKKVYAYVAGNRLTERCTADNCPMPVMQKPLPETQDYLVTGLSQFSISKKFWAGLLIFLVVAQGLISWFSPLSQKGLGIIGVRNSKVNESIRKPYEIVKTPLKKYFGLTHHTIFLDEHFRGYNHIVKVEYVTNNNELIHVPILRDNGMTDDMVSGIIWRNISFNVVTPKIEKQKLEKGIVPYLAYFSNKQPQKLPDGKFVFYVKEIDIPQQWEKDFLKKQMAKPWTKAGEYVGRGFLWTEEMEALFESEMKPAK